jgi:hypothetical protein
MSAIEWIPLFEAAMRLEDLWGIPRSIAEGIVQNVLEGGAVEVRGVKRYQLVPQIITEQIRTSLFPNSLVSPDWESIEIDWNELVMHGRKLVPGWIEVTEPPARRKGSSHKRDRAVQAIKEIWPQGLPDPKDLSNGELCKQVSDKIARDDAQRNRRPIPISDDTILRAANRQR